jgi:hypothetical protein
MPGCRQQPAVSAYVRGTGYLVEVRHDTAIGPLTPWADADVAGTLSGGSPDLLRGLAPGDVRCGDAPRCDATASASRATGDAPTRIGRHDAHEVATAVPGHVPSITSFTSLDAVRYFAGDDYEPAVDVQ